MAHMFEKHFTLEEANALVPALRELSRRIHTLLEDDSGPEEGHAQGESSHANGRNGSNGHKTNGNGHGHKPEPALTLEQRIAAANEMLGSVAARGIVIQDWRRGLIDFPAIRDGEEVFLCYELADGAQIQFFHEIDAGYAGRQPL